MMNDHDTNKSNNGIKQSHWQKNNELSDDDRRQIELGALSILRAQEIQNRKDAQDRKKAQKLLRSQVGVYNERRSLLMLVIEYLKLLVFVMFVIALYFGLKYFLAYAYASNQELIGRYESQLIVGMVMFVILIVWLVLRAFNMWSRDFIYADLDRVRRTRQPIWYLGILKISFEVKTKETRCNLKPTNFETAIKSIGVDASTVDMDTIIEHDEPIHNLKYVKNAERLEAIINAIT